MKKRVPHLYLVGQLNCLWNTVLVLGYWFGRYWFRLFPWIPKTRYQNVTLILSQPLGLQPRQGLAKVRAKREAQESHFMLPGVQESVREWTLTLPSELLVWELESRWTPKFSKSDCRGQNHWIKKFLIVIENILEHRCLKWACMTHLET